MVLELNVHTGEYVSGGSGKSYLLFGSASPLHVRVDIDEEEGSWADLNANAVAMLRGSAAISTALSLVRLEPYVKPKRSLTGESSERVDTRVMQVIYKIEDSQFPGKVGQQVDVFIPRRHTSKPPEMSN